MMGLRGSFFKSAVINPLVWIGCALTGFTLHYEGYDKAFEIFFRLETYRNLAIGSALYAALFDRRYIKGGQKLDLPETVAAAFEAMCTILLSWAALLLLLAGYHQGGLGYSAGLRERYRESGWIKDGKTAEKSSAAKNAVSEFLAEDVGLQKGKRYKITPQEDGSFVVEVLE